MTDWHAYTGLRFHPHRFALLVDLRCRIGLIVYCISYSLVGRWVLYGCTRCCGQHHTLLLGRCHYDGGTIWMALPIGIYKMYRQV
eukprot:scaffold516_cov175-Amphora_coffeaeformis.AAC.42